MSVVPTRTLLFGGACAVGGAVTPSRLRGRPHEVRPTAVVPAPFAPRPATPVRPDVAMSPAELDSALAAAFPGDETPGYL